MAYLQLAVGLALLVIGGEGLVRGCVTLARRLEVSTLLIGLTIAAYGTSGPELVVSLDAARRGATAIALGNVVGSNIANVLLILAIAALIRPVAASRAALWRDGMALAAATLLLAGLLLLGGAVLWHGIVLLLLLVALVVYTYRAERRDHGQSALLHEAEAEALEPAPIRPLAAVIFVAAGLGLLAYGANLFVEGAVTIARTFAVSEAVIGLTLVAIGTSLPELFTTGIAARRGQSQLALGNVIGSNVFNVLGIVGITALVTPLPTPPDIGLVDIGLLVGSMLLLNLFVATGLRLVRWEAALLLLLYLGYLGLKLQGL